MIRKQKLMQFSSRSIREMGKNDLGDEPMRSTLRSRDRDDRDGDILKVVRQFYDTSVRISEGLVSNRKYRNFFFMQLNRNAREGKGRSRDTRGGSDREDRYGDRDGERRRDRDSGRDRDDRRSGRDRDGGRDGDRRRGDREERRSGGRDRDDREDRRDRRDRDDRGSGRDRRDRYDRDDRRDRDRDSHSRRR